MSFFARLAADIAVQMGQPITAFCDLHTAHADGDCVLTDRGEALSIVRVLGVRRVLREADVEAAADAMREEMTGALERPGHALHGGSPATRRWPARRSGATRRTPARWPPGSASTSTPSSPSARSAGPR